MNEINQCSIINSLDGKENPTGGSVKGTGLEINWQDGPLGNGVGVPRNIPNGAFVETVISAALQRLEFFQESKFKCRENALAITKLQEALHWLEARTKIREIREVEGMHTV